MSPVTFDNDRLTARVAENIKVARIRRGLSGRDLGDRLGVSHTWVSARETGAVSCTLRDVAAIAAAFGMSEAELLGFDEESLVRSEAREVDDIIRNEDREYEQRQVDAFLAGLGMLVAGMYASVVRRPRRRALPAAPKEAKMRDSRPAEKRTRR
jgi:transcriptional regulator with XRE-family HTH domain